MIPRMAIPPLPVLSNSKIVMGESMLYKMAGFRRPRAKILVPFALKDADMAPRFFTGKADPYSRTF